MNKILSSVLALLLSCQIGAATNNKIIDTTKSLSPTTPTLTSRNQLLGLLPHNAVVIEIGAERGDFSSEILTITNPKELYLIDCWEEQDINIYPENRTQQLQNSYYQFVLQRFAGIQRVKVIKGFSEKLAKNFPDNYFDWIYIDANHAYDAVKLDLETWLPKVKNGGFIAGHDYFVNGYFGVIQAVNEFLIKHNFTMTYLTQESIPSYAIKIVK